MNSKRINDSMPATYRIEHLAQNTTVHWIDDERIYASNGYEVLISRDKGACWEVEGSVPVFWWWKKAAQFPALRYMSRTGIYAVYPLSDGSRLCIASRAICRAEPGEKVYRKIFKIENGSHPLNLCLTNDGRIYWGEYFLNLRRAEPIRIFSSGDGGISWETVYVFPAGSICHVHRLVYDPYEDAILVCTGDRDAEVAIFRTRDRFKTMEPLLAGNQFCRTTCLFPQPDCILYGTDNPNGENFVMAIDRRRGKVERIQAVPGPVIFGCKVGAEVVLSTMVENGGHEVTLWAGNKNGFRLIANFRAAKRKRLWLELAGYPMVILPEGEGSGRHVYCTPVGTTEFNASLIRVELDETDRPEDAANHLSQTTNS